ncbi:10609_t:CDS:2, partial [Paraglomus brasilianum]
TVGTCQSAQKGIFIAESKAENVTKSKKIKSLESMIKILEGKLSSAQKDLEAISKPVIGGDVEKNISNSSNISVVSEPNKNLSKYFVRRKNMEEAERIDNDISTQTNDEITEPSKVNIEISPKINEGTNEISEDIIPKSQEIKNVTPHLVQRENNMSSLIESHSQIPIGGIGAIPVVASSLMSPLSAY